MTTWKPILVFDFETTGLTLHPDAPPEAQPRAIEFGGVYLNPEDGSVVVEFEFLIDPLVTIEPVITKITGITNDMLAGQPSWYESAQKLTAIFSAASCAVAHNLPFDKAILSHENKRNGTFVPFPEKQFCTLELYRQAWGKDMKLTALYESVCGRKLEQKHRGLSDVLALADIIRHDRLYEIMR
ncbi:MAG TPA: 3'-5' exonuclease [Abditibacteriaceae bacterium]